jgi:mannobiose 2-epimerase
MDWIPKPDDLGKFSSFYGHEVEFAYLLLDAMDALGRPRESIRPVVLGLIDHAMKFGFDPTLGGIAARGPRLERIDSQPGYEGAPLTKEWWEQAECLTALITAFRWTGERKYLADFEKEWAWVDKHTIDHTDGDWFVANDWVTGAPTRMDKGMGGWKVCYHNGRAMIRVTDEIRDLLAGKPFAPGD